MARHRNNFDLLRLIAAAQVLISHTAAHMDLKIPALIGIFPGVPIFFVISGYLVSESFERTALRIYFVNRALRIYPGLWACLAVSMLIAMLWGDVKVTGLWIAAQATIVQFYNPPYLREFGVGVLNGSLWTIPVELQFYLALPVIYAMLRTNRALIAALVAGIACNVFYAAWSADTFAHKLIGVTLPPYLYMFLIGVWLQKNRTIVTRYLVGRLPTWLTVYALVATGAHLAGLEVGGNLLNPVSAIALAALVISAAHARAIPLRHDLSYGLYLYHMPVANAFIESGARSYVNALEVAGVTAALAFTSWVLVERPALGLKRHFKARRSVSPSTYHWYSV